LQKTADYSFEFQGSSMYMRVWEPEEGAQGERPVVVIEPSRSGVPFNYNRVDLAKELAGRMNTTLDDMQWFEQGADGKLNQYEFKPYEVEHRPYANDMSRDQYEAAEKQGALKPDVIQGHHAVYSPISDEKKESVEANVGEVIQSREQVNYESPQARERRENQEFAQQQNQDSADLSFTPSESQRQEFGR